MTILENPFTPSFGEIPARLAGRKQIVADVVRALESQRRPPELTTILSGARGNGETILLSLLPDRAAAQGWIVASVTSMPGMLDDIEIRTRRATQHFIDEPSSTHVTSIGIPQIIDAHLDVQEPAVSNWRVRMDELLDIVEAYGAAGGISCTGCPRGR